VFHQNRLALGRAGSSSPLFGAKNLENDTLDLDLL
jgi:hypothetical protein